MVITVLMVAEKPSIAASIAKVLCSTANKRSGASSVCGVFEFDGSFRNQRARIKVTSTAGHVFSVDFPPECNNWEKVNPVDLFGTKIISNEAAPKNRLVKHFRNEGKGVDHLVLWLDCDREGENICFEVISLVKPVMNKHHGQQIWRASFSAVAASDILKALSTLGEPDENQSLAVEARQELDLKVGCSFTRFQTHFFQGKYGDLEASLLSYGPCQTPTLQFCVHRHDQITSFQPETYYRIEVEITVGEKICALTWDRKRVFDRPVAETFLKLMNEFGNKLTLSSTSQSMKTKSKPQPLNTVALLMEASDSLGIGPHRALQIAESLYLRGLTTYPRTETRKYPDSFDIAANIRMQTGNQMWGDYASQLLRKGIKRPRSGEDAGDHPPIVPVSSANEANFSSNEEWKIYSLITRSFLASVSDDCTLKTTEYNFTCGYETFTLKGSIVLNPGFTAIYTLSEYKDQILPDIPMHHVLTPTNISISVNETSPPSYLSESDLLGKMETEGIGTDASMPSHINNIIERNYVTLIAGRRLQPTKLGIALIHGYMLIDPELVLPKVRASIESYCDLIAKGKATKEEVVAHSLHMFRQKFEFLVDTIDVMDQLFQASFTSLLQSGLPFSKCGVCKRYMKLLNKKPQRLYCPSCEVTHRLPDGGTIKLFKEIKCPFDSFELVLFCVKGGKNIPLCPMCYNNPPYGKKKNMSCLECLHPTCKQSILKSAVCQCPQSACEGKMFLDSLSAPLWKFDCNTCNFQLKVKYQVHKILVTEDECEECGNIQISVIPKKDSKDDAAENVTGCLVCNEEINGMVDMGFSRMYERRRGRGGRGRGRGRGRKRGEDPKLSFADF